MNITEKIPVYVTSIVVDLCKTYGLENVVLAVEDKRVFAEVTRPATPQELSLMSKLPSLPSNYLYATYFHSSKKLLTILKDREDMKSYGDYLGQVTFDGLSHFGAQWEMANEGEVLQAFMPNGSALNTFTGPG